jgi:uncharacterized protein (DUF58 family)
MILRERMRRLRTVFRSRRRLARLNHVLIPEKKPDRDRLRRRWVWRLATPLFAVHSALSPEGRALLLLTFLVGLASVDVMRTQVYLLFGALAGIVLASIALRPLFRARGVQVSVENAARVSVGEAQRFLIHVDNAGPKSALGLRVGGPFLPWDGVWAASPPGIAALAPGRRETVVAEARFSARGEHHLDPFEVAMLVPLGVAVGPRTYTGGARFLVVPRIADVGDFTVVHRQPQTRGSHQSAKAPGESDIVGVRPYRAGDALKHLHARTWARTGTPHVRMYVAEQSDRVGLAVAVDGDSATDEVKEAAISVAAGVAAALVRQGAGIDLLVVGGAAHSIEPRIGRSALDGVLDRLATLVLSDERADFDAAIEERAPSLSTLVVVTADDAHRGSIERLQGSGLPVRWIWVHGEAETGGPGDPTCVPASEVERGRRITL